MKVDLSTLRALAEVANRPEPPNTYQGPDGLSWALSREAWKTAQRDYLAAVEAMGPAGLLRLLAVAEAACRFGFDRQRGHPDQHMRGCACFDGGHCNCGCPELYDALAALKDGNDGR